LTQIKFAESHDEASSKDFTKKLERRNRSTAVGPSVPSPQSGEGTTMRARIWAMKPSDAEADAIESRFPPGTRSGEGSQSLHVFLEAARKARLPALPLQPRQHRRERSRSE